MASLPVAQSPPQHDAAHGRPNAAQVIARTQAWLEHAVIGLNLCPFAKAVHVKQQIHYAVSRADTANALLADLEIEISALRALDSAARETTLLIAPGCCEEFLEFNDLLRKADRWLAKAKLQDEFQIASFHPRYVFAGAAEDDVSHCTNRAPFPILHLLREASVTGAIAAVPEASLIYEHNIDTLKHLGHEGWQQLAVRWSGSPSGC